MSDYYEAEIEPIIGNEDFENVSYSKRKKGETLIYFLCENCYKRSRTQKTCCDLEMTKCYDL